MADNQEAQQGQEQFQDQQAAEQQNNKTVDTPDLDKMSEQELRELASAALDSKRAANEEAKQHRLKLKEYEDAEQKQKDEELSWKDRFEKKQQEFDAYKQEITTKEVQQSFIKGATEAGLPEKIAKTAVKGMDDLSADNINAKVKEAVKEFSEFVKKGEEKSDTAEKDPFQLLASQQPSSDSTNKKENRFGSVTSADVVRSLLEMRNQDNK